MESRALYVVDEGVEAPEELVREMERLFSPVDLDTGELFEVRLTQTSMKLPSGLSRDDWMDLGDKLRFVSHGVQFWAGDWLAYGEDKYGEEAFAILDVKDKTLANWASTCRRVAPSRRREELRYSHHAEVAPLPPVKQTLVLEEAVTNDYTVRQTRERAEAVKVEAQSTLGSLPEKEGWAPWAEEGLPKQMAAQVGTRVCTACEGSRCCEACGEGRCPRCGGEGVIPDVE